MFEFKQNTDFDLIGMGEVMPVSYTHLDVYKRQCVGWLYPTFCHATEQRY